MSRQRKLVDLGPAHTDARTEMRDELEFHVESRVEQLVAQGWTAEAARAEALRRIGDPQAVEASAAASRQRRLTREWARDFADDVRYAFRGLLRNPGFTAIAVLTIAIGIGANTAIYTAVDALLLRALPFREPGRLMDIVQSSPTEGEAVWSWPKYAFYRDNQRAFGALAVHTSGPATLSAAEPERIEVEETSAAYLRALGVTVAHGRDFPTELDAGPAQPRMAIISDALWQRHFAADPGAIGQRVLIDNDPWEVIGVLPPGFRGLSGRPEALVNVTARAAADLQQEWSLEFSMVGRLADGIEPAVAMREAEQLGPRIYDAFPMQAGTLTTSSSPAKWTAAARPLDSIRVASGLRRSLLVLFGAVALVLLMACVNLANLLLARAVSRRQEIAVRLAIGARRGRLVRLLVAESLTLAVLGGVASLGVAWLGTRVISSVNPQDTLRVQGLQGGIGAVGFESVQFDGRALAFTLAVTLLVGVVFGLVPALRATRGDLVSDIKDGTSGGGAARRVGSSRRLLVVAEVAMAVVLLTGSGLMIRSLKNILDVDPGFDSRGVLTLRLSLPPGTFAPDSMPGFYEQLQESIAAVPGVERVALADCPPLNNGCNGTIMTFADRPKRATGNAMVGVHWVSPDWFATMRVPLKQGRLFDATDRLESARVVLINEEAARRYFPGEDPIGKRVAVFQGGFDKGAEVIGIVGDVRYGTIDSTARPDTYISYGQARMNRMMIFVRTQGDPSSLIGAVREAARRTAPTAPIYDIRPMSARHAAAGAQARFSAIVLGLFAAVALSLAVMGIYGVMSYGVAQRTREIGIRMALGADRGSVLAMILRDVTILAGLGLLLGTLAALGFTRVLRSLLFDVQPSDPLTYVIMGVLLAVTALAAGWLPARRAARVEPSQALRRA